MMALPLRGRGRLKFLRAARVPHARPPRYACRAAILVRMIRSIRPATECLRLGKVGALHGCEPQISLAMRAESKRDQEGS